MSPPRICPPKPATPLDSPTFLREAEIWAGALAESRRIVVLEFPTVAAAEAALAADEKAFSELTRALADLTARRNQLERAASEHSIRLARLDSQIAEVDAELRGIEEHGAGPDIEALAAAVAEKGAVVSEFPLGTIPHPQNFPRRNRVIAGWSRAVVVSSYRMPYSRFTRG